MKDISKYTPNQLRELADKLEKQEKPTKKAILKMDIYYVNDNLNKYLDHFSDRGEIDELIEKIEDSIIAPQGSEVYFFPNSPGWYIVDIYARENQIIKEDEYICISEIEEKSQLKNWEKIYLKNIKNT